MHEINRACSCSLTQERLHVLRAEVARWLQLLRQCQQAQVREGATLLNALAQVEEGADENLHLLVS